MRKLGLASVAMLAALSLLAAACSMAWAYGGGGGGGGGAHGGSGGGFSGGGFGGGRGGPGGSSGGFSGSGRAMNFSGGHSYGGAGWQGHPGSLAPSRGPQAPQGFRDLGQSIRPADHGAFNPSGHPSTTLMDRNGLGERMMGPNWAHHEATQAHHPWDQHFVSHYWHHDWDHFYHRFAYYPFPFFFWPFWDYPWYWGFARPYAYTYLYCYDFSLYDVSLYPYASPAPVPTLLTAEQAGSPSTAAAADDTGLNALEFYNAAREAFKNGDYRKALRLAGHAAVESPENVKIHELTSLALMALGDYRGAAIEAHAVLAFGPVADWNTLFGYYEDAAKYTKQLRALEDHVKAHPSSAEGQFLLGYQYLMIGARDDAKTHIAEAARLTPKDKLAAHMLQQLEAGRPVTPPPPKPSEAK